MDLRLRVYYEDTDASGVAYHARYLHWLERARTEWLRGLGFSQETLIQQSGVGFTVASLDIRYLKPARLDNELVVSTRVRAVGRASIQFEQTIRQDHTHQLLASANVKVGCVDVSGFKPRRMPASIESAITQETTE